MLVDIYLHECYIVTKRPQLISLAMRPLHSNDSRIGHQDARRTIPPAANSHMSFFITDEASLDSYPGPPVLPIHSRDSKGATGSYRRGDKDHFVDNVPSWSPFSRASFFSLSPGSLPSQTQPSSVSRPITPITLGPSCVGSIDSLPSSRRNSFASSLSEPVVSYDQESIGEPASIVSMADSGSVPQLVMPCINMPSRRPFTETGKNLGRLKILLAGDHGVGKTSLLKAIVQTCDHIVHIDAISPPAGAAQASSYLDNLSSSFERESLPTTAISEVHASTKPYPEWWQELDTPCQFGKQKTWGDNVLERNICFVDTPGYGRESSVMATITPCVDYVESHLRKVSEGDISDLDLMNMLGGEGGCQVDAALYLISHDLKPADLEYIRRLAPLTNVIPLLARVESLSEEQIVARKQEITRQLSSAGIRLFTFTPIGARGTQAQCAPSIPYTVSSARVSDHDIMDASLLMSPDYVQQLIPTDLAFLVEKMFSLNGAAWLRHSAAKKYLQWRELTPSRPRDLYRPLSLPEPPRPSLALARRRSPQTIGGMAQVRVADWATELQRGLVNERLRYEALCRDERAMWLTEKLHECARDGAVVPVNNRLRETSDEGPKKARNGGYGASKTQQHQDPLGLLQVAADLKVRGWVAVEVLSSLGAVGLAFWISRHGWPTKAAELMGRVDEVLRF